VALKISRFSFIFLRINSFVCNLKCN
jgi:hypothetical protein